MLLSSTREWPWGVVVLGDPADATEVPTSFGNQSAVATESTVVSRIQHGVDGPATATVSVDADSPKTALVHSGVLRLSSGRLRLGDAASEDVDEADLTPGNYTINVFVDDAEHPAHVHFALSCSVD